MSARKPRSKKSKALIALSVSVLGLFVLEGAVRVRQYLSSGTWEEVLEFATHDASGLRIPIPGRVAGAIRIDSRGFRSPELEMPKPEGRIRLAFLGGSTTFCAEAAKEENTWPWRVCEMARAAFPGTQFDFINAGVSGYSVEKSQLNLDHRVAELQPDVIVIYHATNDITKDTRALARKKGVYAGHGDAGSWLAKHSRAWALIEKNLLFQKRMRSAKEAAGRLEFEPDELTPGFEQRLTKLVTSAQEVASIVVLPTFSHRVRREQNADERLAACNTSLYYMPYMSPDGCLSAFEAYNDVIRRVAHDTGALLVEDELDIPADTQHFNDSVHLIGPGLRQMADRVGHALLESDTFAHLIESRSGN